jgi:hypothetical protein
MADFSFDTKDLTQQHPSVRQLYEGGYDLNPNTSNILDGGNFYKFDLFNQVPEEVDPEILKRREIQSKKFSNALGYGFNTSVSSAYELLGSIPGGIDRFYNWGRTTLGFEPDEENIYTYAEDYFKSLARGVSPEAYGYEPPEGYINKTAAGFAGLPVTIAQYIPFVKASGSLAKGIALTDVTREIDDGNAVDIAKAAAYGYGTGKFIGWANNLSVGPRMGALGGFGFLTAGHNANLEDRAAAATVWGAAGYLSPKAEGKPIRVESQSALDYKSLIGRESKTTISETRGRAAEEYIKISDSYLLNRARLKEFEKNLETSKQIEKELAEGKKPTVKIQGEVPTIEALDKLRNKVNELEAHLDAQGKVIFTGERYNEVMKDFQDGIFGERNIEQFKVDQFNRDGTPKFKDMPDTTLQKIINLAIPPSFNLDPLFKYGRDSIAAEKRIDDIKVNQKLFDPKVVTDKKYMPDRKPGESFADYQLRLEGRGDFIKIFGFTAAKSKDAGLTEFQILKEKNPKAAADIIRVNAALDIAKSTQAKANKESYDTRIKTEKVYRDVDFGKLPVDSATGERYFPDGRKGNYNDFLYFKTLEIQKSKVDNKHKYEATVEEIKNEFKKYSNDSALIDQQVRVYSKLRDLSDSNLHEVNGAALKYPEQSNGVVFNLRPNHFPRVFSGDFRVWAVKFNKEKNKYTAEDSIAIGAGNKFAADSILRKLQKDYGGKTVTTKDGKQVSEYKFNIVTKDKTREGAVELDALMELYRNDNLKKQMPELYRDLDTLMSEARTKTGFKKFALPRQQVDGYLGSELAAKNYFLSEKLGTKIDRNINAKMASDFETAVSLYTKGAVTAASRWKTNYNLNNLLNKKFVVPLPNGGFRTTTLQAEFPNSAKALEAQKQLVYGELPRRKFEEVADKIGSKWFGESGLGKALGGMNRFTLAAKLLFGQARFLISQALQPYHMILPKLIDLKYSGHDKSSIAQTVLQSTKDLVLPSKEVAEAQAYFKKVGVVEPKFLNEAMARIDSLAPVIELPGSLQYRGRKALNTDWLVKGLTMQNISSRVEQVSRLNAATQFYNLYRQSGMPKDKAKKHAAYNADKYMVEYTYMEQPGIYGAKGLGTLGRPFGLFKTFQHNYLAQLADYLVKGKQGRGNEGAVAFLTSMVLTAGLFGVIGINTAEAILDKLSPIISRITGKPMPSLKTAILTGDYPDFIKYGLPSSTLGIDLTSTLAAPGLAVQDLVSVPSLNYFGLTLKQARNGRGVIPTFFGAVTTSLISQSPEERREAWMQFLRDSVPTSLHGAVERYYMGIPGPVSSYWKDWSLEKEDENIFKYQAYGPVQNVFKKGRGQITRTLQDWRARNLAAYSLKEREVLNLIYATTKFKRELKATQDTIITAGARHLMKDGFVPLYIYSELRKLGLGMESIETKIANRAELMNSSFLNRVTKRDKSLQKTDVMKNLLDKLVFDKYTGKYGFEN